MPYMNENPLKSQEQWQRELEREDRQIETFELYDKWLEENSIDKAEPIIETERRTR